MKKLIILIAAVLITTEMMAESASSFPGKKKWKTLETVHFRIHYTEELKPHALKLVPIAEEFHGVLIRAEYWQPVSKTDIVLVDITDMANGYSTPFPANKVVMYLSRPQPHDVIGNFDEWLKLLFIHEYTHLLDIDMVHGFPAVARALLGRVIVPNILQPIFIIEGNAVLNESNLTGAGRLNSNYTEMIMRTEFENGNAKSLSLASNYPYEWPAGSIPYLYGAYFNQYLLETKGKSFNRIFMANSNNCLPFLNTINSLDVYDASFGRLYDEWQNAMYDRYGEQRRKISGTALTEISAITESGYRNSLPVFNESGSSIYFVSNNGKEHAALFRYDLESGKTAKLTNVTDPQSLAVDGSDIIMNDIRIYSNNLHYYDLFKISSSGKKQKLSSRARILYADRKGDLAAEIRQNGDLYDLSITRGNETVFRIADSNVQIFYCRFSPAGKKLVFGFRKPAGNTALAVADVDSGSIVTVNEDSSVKLFPSWISEKRLIFSSDRSGVYNLYEIDLDGNVQKRLTNTLTGFFESSVSPDGEKIAAVSYGKRGFDIVMMDYPRRAVDSVPVAAENLPLSYFTAKIPQDDGKMPDAEKYNSFRYLVPSIWIPVLWSQSYGDDVYDSVQLFFYGQDPLEFHTYQMSLGYVFGLENYLIDANYTYSRFVPEVSLMYMNNNIFASDPVDWTYNRKKENDFSLSAISGLNLSFPVIQTGFSAAFSLYGIYEQKTEYSLHMDETYDSRDSVESYLGAGFAFSNASYFPYSVSPEKGFDLSLAGIISDEMLNSDSNNVILYASSAVYLPFFFKNHVLKMNLSGGTMLGEDRNDPFSLGNEYFNSSNFESLSAHGMRGYEGSEKEGYNSTEVSLFYFLPLIRREGGCGTFPVMFSKLYFAPYVSAGNVFTSGSDFTVSEFRKTAGAEIYADFAAAYFIPLTFYAGYGHGFDEEGQDSFYFGIQGVFEVMRKNRVIVK